MKIDKLKVYILEFMLLVFLLFTILFSNIFNKTIIAIVLLIFMVISLKLIKRRKILSIHNKQITVLMLAFGVIYVAVLYILGIYFGFYKSSITFSIWTIINYIIPYIVIIIASEIIRNIYLSRDEKLNSGLMLIAMTLIETILYISTYNMSTLNDYLTLVGFIIFAAIACNLLYNNITIKYGNSVAIIIYRIITTMYVYIFPIIPDVYIFLQSMIRMVYPYMIYLILEGIYTKEKFVMSRKDRVKNNVVTALAIIIALMIVLIISCRFKYGALVVGSGSMTGTINKGDIIIYENYNEEEQIEKGEIIVFNKDNTRVIHRVIEVKNTSGEYHYYTKGDANQNMDDGNIQRQDVIGKVKLKIPYIGYLTLWLNDVFNK